jgi:mono/diheme cytochrome c family protein
MDSVKRYWQLAAMLAIALFARVSVTAGHANDWGAIVQEEPSPRPVTGDGSSQKKAQSAASGTSSPPAPAVHPAALQVYRTSCVECHDLDGRGEAARESLPNIPDFTNGKWHTSRSDAHLSGSILEGKGKSMPRMKKKLGSVDVNHMVALVRGFRDGKLKIEDEPDAPPPAEKPGETAKAAGSAPRSSLAAASSKDKSVEQGRRVFQKSCALCHGRDGKGATARESLPAIPDFTVRGWQQRRNSGQLLVSILDGKGTGMPAFRDKIPREQARELVAYVRTFAPGATAEAASANDQFESRFNTLAREFDELARQIRALSAPEGASPTSPARGEPAAKKK